MAASGSFERGGQPRTVPDEDAEAYEAAAQQQRAHNRKQQAELDQKQSQNLVRSKRLGDRLFTLNKPRGVGHPGQLESFIPIWGAAREAAADGDDGDYVGMVLNTGMAALDVIPMRAVAGAASKGMVKTSGPHAWRTKPWEGVKGARQWLGEKGYLQAGEHGHHWAIPQNGWGKAVPDWIKNQPWNIKGLDAVTHGRIHGRYTVDGVKLPRFKQGERIWRGTPNSAKAAVVTTPGGFARARDDR